MAVVSIAGSWTLYLVFVAIRLAIIGFPREGLLLQRHLLSALAGAILTTLMYLMLRQVERAPIVVRIAAALLLALPVAALLALVNFEFLYVLAREALWSGLPHPVHKFSGIFPRTILEIYLVFAGWSGIYTSVTSALQSQEAQRRTALLQAETKEAQLQALRYQLNPHFLFNALNTVSALVLRGDAAAAESTIQALSLFLRSALAPNATDDIPLAEELDLERLYLSIEQVRFRDRLRVEWSVPTGLADALVPPLLLQPLVENVIRHAVTPSRGPVTMFVGAFTEHRRLHVLVEDDGPAESLRSGHGIGLRNAASRLQARFGEAGRCVHGPRTGGGFRVELVMPLYLQSKGV